MKMFQTALNQGTYACFRAPSQGAPRVLGPGRLSARRPGWGVRILMVLLTLSIFLIDSAVASAESSGTLSVSTSLNSEDVLIGEPVHCEISLRGPAGTRVPSLQLPNQLGDFELLEQER